MNNIEMNNIDKMKIAEVEQVLVEWKKTYRHFKKCVGALQGKAKVGEIAVITKGYNTDKIFFCTRITPNGQIEGVFTNGEVYIGELKHCRRLIEDDPAIEEKFNLLKNFMERSRYE